MVVPLRRLSNSKIPYSMPVRRTGRSSTETTRVSRSTTSLPVRIVDPVFWSTGSSAADLSNGILPKRNPAAPTPSEDKHTHSNYIKRQVGQVGQRFGALSGRRSSPSAYDVRTRLHAGGRWIRTLVPPLRELGRRFRVATAAFEWQRRHEADYIIRQNVWRPLRAVHAGGQRQRRAARR